MDRRRVGITARDSPPPMAVSGVARIGESRFAAPSCRFFRVALRGRHPLLSAVAAFCSTTKPL